MPLCGSICKGSIPLCNCEYCHSRGLSQLDIWGKPTKGEENQNKRNTHNPRDLAKFKNPASVSTAGELKPEMMTLSGSPTPPPASSNNDPPFKVGLKNEIGFAAMEVGAERMADETEEGDEVELDEPPRS